MSLRVLCAGCSPEDRERAESDVRRALGARTEAESWNVSLVKIQGRWSVTLDGPGARALTCTAPEGRLSESIRQALAGPAPPAAAPAPSSSALGSRRDRHACTKCHGSFLVTYEAGPDEPEETVPVACPRCWHMNHVLVAESAAESRDYKAETA